MSLQFNGALAQQVAALRAASPGLNLYLLDVGAFTAEAQANPAAFGYTNVTDAVLQRPVADADPVRVAAATYFYWDSFHPTATTQQPALPARGEAASDLIVPDGNEERRLRAPFSFGSHVDQVRSPRLVEQLRDRLHDRLRLVALRRMSAVLELQQRRPSGAPRAIRSSCSIVPYWSS